MPVAYGSGSIDFTIILNYGTVLVCNGSSFYGRPIHTLKVLRVSAFDLGVNCDCAYLRLVSKGRALEALSLSTPW